MTARDEARLRDLLHDSVSDVEPRSGLEEIRTRTRGRDGRRPWVLGAGAAALATAATVTAIALTADGPGLPARSPGVAAGSAVPSPAPAYAAESLAVYYVGQTGQGPRLYRELHAAVASGDATTPQDVVSQALAEAVAGSPQDPDYRTPWPVGTQARATLSGSGAGAQLDVDLTSPVGTSLRERPAGMSSELAAIAVQQLAYTAQSKALGGVPVSLRLDGAESDTVLGSSVSRPLGRASREDVLGLVQIATPTQGESVASGFTVRGVGAFFEANVVWELRQGSEVVRSGFTTAATCCRLAPYSFEVTAPPGDYTLVVRDEDASGGAGPPPFLDTKDVTVER